MSPTYAVFTKNYHTKQQSLKSIQIDKAITNFNANYINKHLCQTTYSNFKTIDPKHNHLEQSSVKDTTNVNVIDERNIESDQTSTKEDTIKN